MCLCKKLYAGCTLAFGAGVLLASLLPGAVLVCVQGVAIIGVGLLLIKP